MKLAVDAYNLAADRRGMGRYVHSVFAGLRELGGVEIVLVAKNAAQAAALQDEYPYGAVVAKNLRSSPPDAVWFCWNAMRFAPNAPAVATIYDPFAFSQPHHNPVARWREQLPIRRSLRRADALMTISAWSARELRARFGVMPDAITVAPPVVDRFWHRVETPEEATPYVLVVGGPEARKNIAFFARAFDAAFPSQGPRLVIAGTLGENDERELFTLRTKVERVHPDDGELRDLYSGALAVAVPSSAEGFGIVALEAMACGSAVLAADAAALPEACGGAALLLPPGDRDAWIDALRALQADPALRRDLQERALARAALIDPLAPARTLLSVTGRLLS